MRVATTADDLGSPSAPGWDTVPSQHVSLAPPPIETQPTEYIREKWASRPYGTVTGADVALAHDETRLFVRVAWSAPDASGGEFCDAGAVCFPGDPDASSATFGAPGAPVHVWLWEDGRGARPIEATGPGAFRPGGGEVSAAAVADGDARAIVLVGDLAAARAHGRFAVACWSGANEERAGLGAVSPEWIELDTEGKSA